MKRKIPEATPAANKLILGEIIAFLSLNDFHLKDERESNPQCRRRGIFSSDVFLFARE